MPTAFGRDDWDGSSFLGSFTLEGGISVQGNAGGSDQSTASLKSTAPPENSAPLKSTVPPENPAVVKPSVPPEN
jgi:hypothetical protein